MLRRLARLALSLTLATTALTSTAAARGFAQAPGAGLPAPVETRTQLRVDDEAPVRPRIPAAARARLRKVLAARRAKNVAAFRAYARRGVYPHNYVSSGRLNVWRDEDGHLCAAATMIWRSGARALVNQTAAADNYVRLADVTQGPLLDWILTSGLTHEEVVAIQEPMMGQPDLPDRPGPGSQDWRIAEDARLRARYDQVLAMLDGNREGSLEGAIDALAGRPDLIASLLTRAR